MNLTVEEQLSTVLTPVFGTELYPIVHPDPDGTASTVANLYAVFTKIGGQSVNKLSGDDPVSRARMQISAFSIDYGSLNAAEQSMNAAMLAANVVANTAISNQQNVFSIAGALANISSSVPTYGFEDETRRYYFHADYYIWTSN